MAVSGDFDRTAGTEARTWLAGAPVPSFLPACILCLTGKHASAVLEFTYAIEMKPIAEFFVHRGEAYMQQKVRLTLAVDVPTFAVMSSDVGNQCVCPYFAAFRN